MRLLYSMALQDLSYFNDSYSKLVKLVSEYEKYIKVSDSQQYKDLVKKYNKTVCISDELLISSIVDIVRPEDIPSCLCDDVCSDNIYFVIKNIVRNYDKLCQSVEEEKKQIFDEIGESLRECILYKISFESMNMCKKNFSKLFYSFSEEHKIQEQKLYSYLNNYRMQQAKLIERLSENRSLNDFLCKISRENISRKLKNNYFLEMKKLFNNASLFNIYSYDDIYCRDEEYIKEITSILSNIIIPSSEILKIFPSLKEMVKLLKEYYLPAFCMSVQPEKIRNYDYLCEEEEFCLMVGNIFENFKDNDSKKNSVYLKKYKK